MKEELVNLTYTIELQPGEKLTLPPGAVQSVGPGRWVIHIRPAGSNGIRRHDAFLNSYAAEDEGLYDGD